MKVKKKKKQTIKKCVTERHLQSLQLSPSLGAFRMKHWNCSPCSAGTALAVAAGVMGFAYQVSQGAGKA